MKFLNLPLVLPTLIERAWAYRGSTYPNPPVGAVLLNREGEVLSLQVHQQRGQAHAEAAAIIDARDRGVLAFAHTLIVTLEPCNHQGMTPPCTQAILGTPIRRVIYLCEDTNPRVAGGGAA